MARQTDLDDIGIPCYASFRPASRTMSTNQGKGIWDDDAMASAVMEAVEFAVAEAPLAPSRFATLDQLQIEEMPVYWPGGLLPDAFRLQASNAITWLPAFGLYSGHRCLVPRDAVALNARATELVGVCQTTNGLASGNDRDEAIFHAICELIERDGTSYWMLKSQDQRHLSRFDPEYLSNGALDHLLSKVRTSGRQVVFYDQTTDIGCPTVMALIGESSANRKFDLAAGYAAHPDAATACIRALLEAAQTRVTSIAAARDDISPHDFAQLVDEEAFELAMVSYPSRPTGPDSMRSSERTSERNATLIGALKGAGVSEPVVVELDDGTLPCSVVRVLCAALEDIEVNPYWRPGSRATKWLQN